MQHYFRVEKQTKLDGMTLAGLPQFKSVYNVYKMPDDSFEYEAVTLEGAKAYINYRTDNKDREVVYDSRSPDAKL